MYVMSAARQHERRARTLGIQAAGTDLRESEQAKSVARAAGTLSAGMAADVFTLVLPVDCGL